jgi:hypothetical protein
MSAPFVSFTIDREGRTVEMYANTAEIDKLIDTLQRAKREGRQRLWDTSLGGFLSEKDPFGNDAVYEVVITMGGD